MKKDENQREFEILVVKIKGNELNHEWHEGYENCQEIITLLEELQRYDELKEYNHKSYFFEKAHENERDKDKKSTNIEPKPEVGEEIDDLDQKEEEQQMMEEEKIIVNSMDFEENIVEKREFKRHPHYGRIQKTQ